MSELIFSYRDLQHEEHRCAISFPLIVPLCKKLASGTEKGVFEYKYHVRKSVFETFVKYLKAAANKEQRLSLINLDNVVSLYLLGQELQCSILTEDCNTWAVNSAEINEAAAVIERAGRQHNDIKLVREVVMKYYKHFFAMMKFESCQKKCNPSDQFGEKFLTMLMQLIAVGDVPSEVFIDWLESMDPGMSESERCQMFYGYASILDWSTMPRRLEYILQYGPPNDVAIGHLAHTLHYHETQRQIAELKEQIKRREAVEEQLTKEITLLRSQTKSSHRVFVVFIVMLVIVVVLMFWLLVKQNPLGLLNFKV